MYKASHLSFIHHNVIQVLQLRNKSQTRRFVLAVVVIADWIAV